MENPQKRKERLKAMRMEAEEAEASHNATTAAVPGCLSNPLADTDIPVQAEPCAPSRFDFYTDPMAAFSSDTKRSKVGNQIAPNHFKHSGGPRNPGMNPPPAHQFPSNYSPDQRMYQVQGFYQNFGPQRSPIGMERPLTMHHGNPSEVWTGAEGVASYSFPSDPLRECRFPSPGFRPQGSPGFRPQGIPGFRPQGSPAFGPPGSPAFGPPGSPGFGPPGSPGFGPPGSPGFGPPGIPGFGPPGSLGFGPPGSPGFRPPGSRGSNTGKGRDHWLSHNPSPHSVHGGSPSPSSSSGRGGGCWNRSPGSGRRGGRGLGSHGHSAMDRQLGPELFYNDSMIENPWKFLKPVIWKEVGASLNGLYTYDSSKPSKVKSSCTEHANVSEGSNKSNSQPSLAEYLAASFSEAVNDSPSI